MSKTITALKNATTTLADRIIAVCEEACAEDHAVDSAEERVIGFMMKSVVGDLCYSSRNQARWNASKAGEVVGEIRDLIENSRGWGEAQDNAVVRKQEYVSTLEARAACFNALHQAFCAAHEQITGEKWMPRVGRTVDSRKETAAVADAKALLERYAGSAATQRGRDAANAATPIDAERVA